MNKKVSEQRITAAAFRIRISNIRCFAIAAVTASLLGIMFAAPTQARPLNEELYASGTTRIILSAKMRGLAEAMASASCRVIGDIGTADAQEDLLSSSQEFVSILDGLRNGNADIGLHGVETHGRTIQALDATTAIWDPVVAKESLILLSDNSSASDAAVIHDGYVGLVEQVERLAAVVAGHYADPQHLLKSDATILNFASRQRVLVYRMTRDMCELAIGTGAENTKDELQASTDQFEQTLIALRDGFAAVGINPPPNEAVRDSIVSMLVVWQAERDVFDTALAGEIPAKDLVARAADLSNRLSDRMDETIFLYLDAAFRPSG